MAMDPWCHSLKGRHALTDQNKTINEPTGVSQVAFVSVSHCKPERLEGGHVDAAAGSGQPKRTCWWEPAVRGSVAVTAC